MLPIDDEAQNYGTQVRMTYSVEYYAFQGVDKAFKTLTSIDAEGGKRVDSRSESEKVRWKDFDLDAPLGARYDLTQSSLLDSLHAWAPTSLMASSLPIGMRAFSLFVSLLVVSVGVVSVSCILLSTLRADLRRFSRLSLLPLRDWTDLEENDTGWKQLQNDVLRRPRHAPVHSAMTGVSVQLCATLLGLATWATLRPAHALLARGDMASTAVLMFCVAQFFAGLATTLHARFFAEDTPTTHEKRQFPAAFAVTLALLCPTLVLLVSTLASQASLAASLCVLAAWCFLALPLHVAGCVVGAKLRLPKAPCRATMTRRPIPMLVLVQEDKNSTTKFVSSVTSLWRLVKHRDWHTILREYSQPMHLAVVSAVPIAAVAFVEMYLTLGAFWHSAGLLAPAALPYALVSLLCFLCMCVCTACVSTYTLLSAENWQWTQLPPLMGLCFGLFVCAVSFVFWLMHTAFGSATALLLYACGTVLLAALSSLLVAGLSHLSALVFVCLVYRAVHSD
ncbi:MAG: hypothetical protein MHM6MM_008304 [Cercozoa sp. M6MM]